MPWLRQLGKTESEINQKAEEAKKIIDARAGLLLMELNSASASRLSDMEVAEENVDKQLALAANFKNHLQRVKV